MSIKNGQHHYYADMMCDTAWVQEVCYSYCSLPFSEVLKQSSRSSDTFSKHSRKPCDMVRGKIFCNGLGEMGI